jgi:hypothetical protein
VCKGHRLFASRPCTPTRKKSQATFMDPLADAVCYAA